MTCGGVAAEHACAVTSGTAGVRCARSASGGVVCSCTEAPFAVVATLAQMPTTKAFYGALAMLCGATCPEPAACMPTVSCYEGWACQVSSYETFGLAAPHAGPQQESLSCAVGDNRPPVPGGPKVSCVCGESGPFEPAEPLPIGPIPSIDLVLALWREHCAPGCR
jgi:hypothetical protein